MLSDDLRRLVDELGHGRGGAPEWLPAVDVIETDAALHVVIDLAGVDRASLDVRASGDTLIVAGAKASRACSAHATFHVAERSFGRFARLVRLPVPCDLATARATFANGELTIVIPRVDERRGREFRIPIADANAAL
jgi:HSP20 family protein